MSRVVPLWTFLDSFSAFWNPFRALLDSLSTLLRFLRTFDSFQIGSGANPLILVQNSLVSFNVLPSLWADRNILSFNRLLVKILVRAFRSRFVIKLIQVVFLIFNDHCFSNLFIGAWGAVDALDVYVSIFLERTFLGLREGLETTSVHFLR